MRGGGQHSPMSELQKASCGWMGTHVHASATKALRLQLQRSARRLSHPAGMVLRGVPRRYRRTGVAPWMCRVSSAASAPLPRAPSCGCRARDAAGWRRLCCSAPGWGGEL